MNVSGGTVQSNGIVRTGNMVNASCRIYGGQWTADGTFFIIPSGFRPSGTRRGIASMVVGGASKIIICNVNASGNVYISYSSSQTTTDVLFAITYFL